MLQCCVCRLSSSMTLCIVAKRCVLEHKLLLTAYRKSYEKSIGTKMNDLGLCLDVILRSCQLLRHICRRLRSSGPPIGNGIGLRGIKWSRDRWRHVTPKDQTRDLNTLRAQYLENSWRCYLATIANYLLRGSTVGYPSDSLASCIF